MARFNETYDHFAKEILDQCGFKDQLFEEIARNITQIIKGCADRQTLSQIIQTLENKVIKDKSGILLRFFVFAATMTFIDFISKTVLVDKIGDILNNLPKDLCMKCEHMQKQNDGDGFICVKTLDECPVYIKLSDKDKESLQLLHAQTIKE